jgi:DNA processing protein
MEERNYWLGFSIFPGIGPKKFNLLLKYFGTAKVAWSANEKDLTESGIGQAITKKFIEYRFSFNYRDYNKRLSEAKVAYLILTDNDYPTLLKQIDNPPFVLFVKGNAEILRYAQNDKIIAIVGTRKITDYGREVTNTITADLVNAGCVIVSGLAFGVDAIAHLTAIENNGKTIAVLGCGVDCCSPRENYLLYKQILETGGCIVSEYPLSAEPTKGSFPSRNRIIAGLSNAVVVTQGAEDSGSLYTASDAVALQRPVFAVPGPITSQLSKGPHSLIAKGAKLVTGAEDILKELRVTNYELGIKKRSITSDIKEEQIIISLLRNESLHFDELAKKIGLDSSKLGILLSVMEMKGMLKSTGGGTFMLVI